MQINLNVVDIGGVLHLDAVVTPVAGQPAQWIARSQWPVEVDLRPFVVSETIKHICRAFRDGTIPLESIQCTSYPSEER